MGHSNIIRYCKRPFLDSGGQPDVHYMNRTLTDNINAVVGVDDEFYITGDFAMDNPKKYLDKINCKNIILIKGNHDKQSGGLFKEIYDRLQMKIGDIDVLLTHHPWKHTVDQYSHKFIDRMPDIKDYPNTWLLSGHTHNSKPQIDKENKIINLSCEWWDYKPISETRLIEIIKENF